jgi:hypothetical protein
MREVRLEANKFEASIREGMRLAGFNKEASDWIWADFVPRYESVNRTISFKAPPECDAALETVKEYYVTMEKDYIYEMLTLETELYMAKFGLPLR